MGMHKILELRQQLSNKVEELRSLAESDKAADVRQYETLKRECEGLRDKETRLIETHGLHDEVRDLGSGPVSHMGMDGHIYGKETTTTRSSEARDYRGMFYPGASGELDKGGFDSQDEFLRAVTSGKIDQRFLNTSVSSEGGFAVPPGFSSDWMDASLEREILRPRCRVYKMETNDLAVPGYDNTDRSGTLLGGYSGQWLAEGQTGVREQASLRAIHLKSKKLAIFTQLSREILADGLDFEKQIMGGLADAISYLVDESLMVSGTGAGQPISVLNSNATIEVDRVGGQGDPVIFENLITMARRLSPAAHQDAIWVCSHELQSDMMVLSVAIGVSGSHIPAVTTVGGRHQLFGRELIFSEKLPGRGERGSVMLISPKHYALGLRQEVVIDTSSAPGWTEDLIDIRIILRLDGQPVISEPETPRRGTETVSPFITLAEA